mmetsp:Transcript_944/g.2098  ORF Transcript_944/g.2098 Transcript_944/m.2098 type:complete len:459 (-) Transcript_944:146-1522(-)
MAGYGAKLAVDMKEVEALPTGNAPEETARRRRMFCQGDMNGNGIMSLAECDRLIVTVLHIEGLKSMKPVINRAFHAARDIVPPVGDFSPYYIDFHEFRYFLIYLKHYLDLFMIFSKLDVKDAGDGRYSDRRISIKEFKAGVPILLRWGLEPSVASKIESDPEGVFADLDDNGGGVVLFDEFAHWALYNHLFALDGGDDDGMAEALEVLRQQKPNLCGKDLSSIRAAKAKYRADAPISGQGCLRGDDRIASGGAVVRGAEELVKGHHYPGGVKDWESRLAEVDAEVDMPATPPPMTADGRVKAWKASLDRCEAAAASNEAGPRNCRCGCSRPAFGRFSTCCTRCAGPDGPHALDCLGKGYPKCDNGCGRLQFGRFKTCCTKCEGVDGPHARDCLDKSETRRSSLAGSSGALGDGESVAAHECANSCGRPKFGRFPTCCTHCKGPAGPHASDCEQKASSA